MKGNICSKCLESVMHEWIHGIKAVLDWSEKCKVCGDNAVFYARKDEIEKAIYKQSQITKQLYV